MTDLIRLERLTDTLRHRIAEAGEKKCRSGEEFRDGKCRNIKGYVKPAKGAAAPTAAAPAPPAAAAPAAPAAEENPVLKAKKEASSAIGWAVGRASVGGGSIGSAAWKLMEKINRKETVKPEEVDKALTAISSAIDKFDTKAEKARYREDAREFEHASDQLGQAYSAVKDFRNKMTGPT